MVKTFSLVLPQRRIHSSDLWMLYMTLWSSSRLIPAYVVWLVMKALGFDHHRQLYETARETKDALRAACDVSSYRSIFVADFLHRVVYANR
jgi:hypothetical protein